MFRKIYALIRPTLSTDPKSVECGESPSGPLNCLKLGLQCLYYVKYVYIIICIGSNVFFYIFTYINYYILRDQVANILYCYFYVLCYNLSSLVVSMNSNLKNNLTLKFKINMMILHSKFLCEGGAWKSLSLCKCATHIPIFSYIYQRYLQTIYQV